MIHYIIALCICINAASANVQKDLGNFFNALGGTSNATKEGVYQDQQGGYYTGGNLFARNTVHNAQLASIQLPGYRAGCGGIDMFMGAFSHISSEQMVHSLKAMGANAASYAFLLAVETMSPQVKNIMTELNDMAQKINQSNINSCEMAATALGGIWPKSDASKRHLCKMIGTEKKYGSFSDHAAARQGCGAGNQRDSTLDAAKEDPAFKKMLGTEFNLAWNAIQENAFLNNDKKLSAFFMTVSGTIVSRKEGDRYIIHSYPSMADKDALLGALLVGGKVSIYKCMDSDGGKCLVVSKEEIEIKAEESLVARVKEILVSIQNKIYEDTKLTDREIAFLNSTRLPFHKILSVATAYRRGGSPIDVMDYAELGAVDILFQYLSEILDVIHESTDHLRLAQVDDTQIERFQQALNVARKRVIARRSGSFQQIEQLISIVRKTELLEKSLMSKVSIINTEGL